MREPFWLFYKRGSGMKWTRMTHWGLHRGARDTRDLDVWLTRGDEERPWLMTRAVLKPTERRDVCSGGSGRDMESYRTLGT